jgi:D-sedoheptulose 7-phosphate isomerase
VGKKASEVIAHTQATNRYEGARRGRAFRCAACGVRARPLGERRASIRKVADMTTLRIDAVAQHFARSQQVLQAAGADRTLVARAAEIAAMITRTFRNGGKLLIAGNGGSAADAQHIAAEFVCRFKMDREALAAIALTTDTSVLTAAGNDYAFEQVFARQIAGLGRPGDCFLALSTSGRSPNVLIALKAAGDRGIATIGLTGQNGEAMQPTCDLLLSVPSSETDLVQQIHMVVAHAVCGIVERELFGAQAAAGEAAP